jgi:hypothetical protein
MSLNTGSDFEFKTKVAKMTDSYIEIVCGIEGNEEFDEYDAERYKIESKIASLK